MNILVVSKVSIPAKDRTLPAWEHLRALGHTVTVEHPDSVPSADRPDALICMGVTIQDEAVEAMRRFPGIPLYVYNWDAYSWLWKPGQEGKEQAYHASRGQEYDYVKFGDLCRRAKEVWVPSYCTGIQTEMWWGVKHWHVILSSCPWWDHEVRDGGYALCTLRHLPDAFDTAFEECCAELGIPHLRTDHNLSRPDYERTVAECKFLVSHYREASTGGLTLLEAYRLGKPVLLSDSKWHGGKDYFGSRARYFEAEDRKSLKDMLQYMMTYCPPVCPDHKQFIEEWYSDQVMVIHMLSRMEAGR